MSSEIQPVAFLTDFDDTAAVQNVAEMLLEKFGESSWKDVRLRFRQGQMTLKTYQELVFAEIKTAAEVMGEYASEETTLRPGFGEVYQYCSDKNIPVAVVSLGLDLYIKPVLKSNGFDNIPVYCVETFYDNGKLTYTYKNMREGHEDEGNSKGLVVQSFKDRGYKVVYAGDGRSDFEAAREADVIIARSILIDECEAHNINYSTFEDFYDILNILKTLS